MKVLTHIVVEILIRQKIIIEKKTMFDFIDQAFDEDDDGNCVEPEMDASSSVEVKALCLRKKIEKPGDPRSKNHLITTDLEERCSQALSHISRVSFILMSVFIHMQYFVKLAN